MLYRKYKIGLGKRFVGQYEGKVVGLLETSKYNLRYMDAYMLKPI
jgi:hypothetical protein